jgi:hypothetical protein
MGSDPTCKSPMKHNKKIGKKIIIVLLLPLEPEVVRLVEQRTRSGYFQIGLLSLQTLYHQRLYLGSEMLRLIQEPRQCC